MDGESQPLIQQQQSQQQQQTDPVQVNYMQSRAEALESVESTVHELNSIFTQLATVVSQQGELAIRLVSYHAFKYSYHLYYIIAYPIKCMTQSLTG